MLLQQGHPRRLTTLHVQPAVRHVSQFIGPRRLNRRSAAVAAAMVLRARRSPRAARVGRTEAGATILDGDTITSPGRYRLGPLPFGVTFWP